MLPQWLEVHDTSLLKSKPLSFEDQVRRWRCLVDIRGAGFSARIAVLLHTQRTLLYVQRPGLFTWFEDPLSPARLEPWVHYVPVSESLADLKERARYALSPAGAGIARNALRHAREHVTRIAARRYALKQLLEVVAARKSARRAWSSSPWCATSQCVDL